VSATLLARVRRVVIGHDGRALDLNDHMRHHQYRTCNFALYWGFWDYVFGTRYSKEKYPVEYVPSWIVEQRQAAKEAAKDPNNKKAQ